MIKPTDRLTIRRLRLEQLQVKEYQARSIARMLHYVGLLTEYPCDDAGLIHVTPSDTHPGLFAILDGHHRYAASIVVGRRDALCVVVEDPKERKT